MNWKRKTVIRILMLIAWMIESDDQVRRNINDLANHISVAKEN